MLYSERHNQILQLLKKQKNIKVRELAKILFVSESTVRRDITEMHRLGIIERNRGGAVSLDIAEETSLYVRMNENTKNKECAAVKALPHIPDFHSVFIDSSTTALALAHRLKLAYKTVVTNNLQTAMMLSKTENINLIIPGGNISSAGVSVTGSWTSKQLSTLNFDLMITSCASILNGSAYEKSLEQREIKLTVFEHSAKRIMIADNTKLNNKNAIYLYRNLSDFDLVVFDKLSDEDKEQLEGLSVIC